MVAHDVVKPKLFQFHKGAIRTFVFASVVPMPTNFNSIKVRLEHVYNFRRVLLKRFQFHKGAIRTGVGFAVRFYGGISIP